MSRRVARPGVRRGYDLWAEAYDTTPNPLVALDRRHTGRALAARPGQWVLDAGCGTGGHLARLARGGSRPVGLDLSRGMLRVARRALRRVPLAQADLERRFPLRGRTFDVCLSALVSEHLKDLGGYFREMFAALRTGGRLVFSAFHPEMARSGVEANFEQSGTEYRLGAEGHSVDEYVNRLWDTGFRELAWRELAGDAELCREVPRAEKYLGRPLLLLVEARRPLAGG